MDNNARLLIRFRVLRSGFPFCQSFWRDYNDMVSRDIKFVRDPKKETHGMVAVFEDPLWKSLGSP